MNISIIGTAGRDQTPTMLSWVRAQAKVFEVIENVLQKYNKITLVSGGAAWADHLAVLGFLAYRRQTNVFLQLHLPAPFHMEPMMYDKAAKCGEISNYYHQLMTEATDVDSLAQLQLALAHPQCSKTEAAPTQDTKPFLSRNTLVAGSPGLVIAHFPSFQEAGPNQKGSGTADTWRKWKKINPEGKLLFVNF